jgi:hypothetical protein
VGKAKRAHHFSTRSFIDGGHGAKRLCPPYEDFGKFNILLLDNIPFFGL